MRRCRGYCKQRISCIYVWKVGVATVGRSSLLTYSIPPNGHQHCSFNSRRHPRQGNSREHSPRIQLYIQIQSHPHEDDQQHEKEKKSAEKKCRTCITFLGMLFQKRQGLSFVPFILHCLSTPGLPLLAIVGVIKDHTWSCDHVWKLHTPSLSFSLSTLLICFNYRGGGEGKEQKMVPNHEHKGPLFYHKVSC